MKNYDYYPEIIAQNDTYNTDPNIKKSFLSSLIFYKDLVNIVRFSNKQVKQKIYDRYNWTASSIAVLRIVEKAGMKVHVKGMNYLKRFDGPAIIIGNHMSTLETLVLPAIIQPVKSVIFVIKKELIDFPLFGPVASARYPIVVGRSNPREDLKIVMQEGEENIKKGKSIIIFPQKTRSPIFDRTTFNSLGVKLAKKNNIPVIPLALITDAWGNGKFIKEAGKINTNKKVYFEFGEPLKIEGKGTAQHEAVINFIESKFKEWGREDLIKH
ncbi:MAG: 1-acyl-sn-glycerol-3-phosphate acyltransferase [Ignavibacteriae bacterium]|nr:MAG: 1-acyl-sn-glycerol-3-phosphate acyltransferase [Ignavibacteriota bacterium]